MIRILLVDDEPQVARVLQRFLTLRGYEVETAENGRIGFKIFQNSEPPADLVILDKRMPGMNGDEVLREIRKLDSKIPVIMLSGLLSPEERKKSLQIGCTVCLSKPIKLHDLAETIARILADKGRSPA